MHHFHGIRCGGIFHQLSCLTSFTDMNSVIFRNQRIGINQPFTTCHLSALPFAQEPPDLAFSTDRIVISVILAIIGTWTVNVIRYRFLLEIFKIFKML
jgi:hypothetical protein